MAWIRIDAQDGKEEQVTQERVRASAKGYFRDVDALMVAAEKEGMIFRTPFAIYEYRQEA